METFIELNFTELELIDGGKKSLSDWMLLGGALCCIPLNPYAGGVLTVVVFLCTD
ncbi:MAG: hypothetical protein ACI4E1_00715 [Lachnospira sp.]